MPTVSLGVVGSGLIGSTLIDQVTAAKPHLLAKRGIDLRVVAIADVDKQLIVENGLPEGADWRGLFKSSTTPPGFEVMETALLQRGAGFGVVIDCTASQVSAVHMQSLCLCTSSTIHG